MTRALLTTAEMAEADRLTILAGTPGATLMERAGAVVAAVCLAEAEDLAEDRHAVVLCGPGNNGGDGFVVARCLRERGWGVSVYLSGQRDALQGDAAAAAQAWQGPVEPLSSLDLPWGCLVVDALLGAGLSRPVTGAIESAIRTVNASGRRVVAVDIPSGVHGDSGAVMGCAIKADVTVTFFRGKPGHHLMPGAEHAGRLVLSDIGISPTVLDTIGSATDINEPGLWLHRYPWPTRGGHKYKRGHAVVLSGPMSQTGAARMSARAALRAGAGLVTLASPSDALAVNAGCLTAIMLREADGPAGLAALLADARKNAIILGPGLGIGKATRRLVREALTPVAEDEEPHRACVLDADALTSFEGRADELAGLIARSGGPVVITPHDGEFERLFDADHDVTAPAAKTDRVRAAARRLGCVVLLKGPDTVVAEPGGRTSIAIADAPWLATAGAGDVLSGIIGGLLAQAMPVFEAASAGVWLHAAAARHFGPGLIAEDLPEVLPAVLRELQDLRQTTSNQQRSPDRS